VRKRDSSCGARGVTGLGRRRVGWAEGQVWERGVRRRQKGQSLEFVRGGWELMVLREFGAE